MRMLPTRNSSVCQLEMNSDHNSSILSNLFRLKSCEFPGGFGDCSWPFSLGIGNASGSQSTNWFPGLGATGSQWWILRWLLLCNKLCGAMA